MKVAHCLKGQCERCPWSHEEGAPGARGQGRATIVILEVQLSRQDNQEALSTCWPCSRGPCSQRQKAWPPDWRGAECVSSQPEVLRDGHTTSATPSHSSFLATLASRGSAFLETPGEASPSRGSWNLSRLVVKKQAPLGPCTQHLQCIWAATCLAPRMSCG